MKGAFSLIELLLAIVVVGVAVAALPFIAISTGKANAQAVVSEVSVLPLNNFNYLLLLMVLLTAAEL